MKISWNKGFKKKTDPRALDAIQAEYAELLSRSAQLHYQVFVLNREIEKLNKAMLAVNEEGAARQELDKAAAANKATAATTTSVANG